MRRSAVSLVELIVAMSVALVISGVLFFVYVSNQKNAEKGIEILDFLRKATILVEYIKMDIRSSLKDKDSVKTNSQGTEITIKKAQNDKTITVKYKYDKEGHFVKREAPSESKKFGADGKEGTVKSFAVKPVEKMPGFFRIDVLFETLTVLRQGGGTADSAQTEAPGANAKTRRALEFHTLVNKRAPEDSERDILWNYFYPQE